MLARRNIKVTHYPEALVKLHAAGRIRVPRLPVKLSKTVALFHHAGETPDQHAWRRIVEGYDTYDIEDPWTKGELLDLLRGASREPHLDAPWWTGREWADAEGMGPTEGAALAAALVALAESA